MESAEGAVRFYAESSWAPGRSRLLAGCCLAFVGLAIAHGSAAAAPAWELNPPPAAGNFGARLAWAGKQADTLRALSARSPRNQRPGMLLAALSVVAMSDLELALSADNLADATALREFIEKKLGDARVRLGRIAQRGTGGADFALGAMALHGMLGSRDHDEACRYFESAWTAGFRMSAYRLSGCVEATEPVRARALLRLAADAGNAAASEALGRACMESTPRDIACASARVAAAAGAGRPSAKSLLGWMYAQGLGMPVELARARELYMEAAKAGDIAARNNLGEMYETGRGVPADPAKAVEYYRDAAEAGFAPGQFNLGRMYATGSGVTLDPEKARLWLGSALKGGIAPAQQVLDWLDRPAPAPKP
jgi:TPR repeat protein